MIQDKLHHGESSMVLLCGPESLIHHFAGPKNPDKSQGPLTGVLHDLGYSAEQVYKF